MIFGELPVADSEGAILAHSVKHPAGLFKKAQDLFSQAAIEAILISSVAPDNGLSRS